MTPTLALTAARVGCIIATQVTSIRRIKTLNCCALTFSDKMAFFTTLVAAPAFTVLHLLSTAGLPPFIFSDGGGDLDLSAPPFQVLFLWRSEAAFFSAPLRAHIEWARVHYGQVQ